MFSRPSFLSFALILASVLYSSTVYSLELIDTIRDSEQPAVFVSIRNTTLSPVSITFSNGVSVEIPKVSSRLIPCTNVEGLVMFMGTQTNMTGPSPEIRCGHSYTLKENAL